MKVVGCLLKGLLAAVAGVALLVLLMWLPTLWPFLFHREYTLPVSGQVLDAVTGKPVAKVLVTSEWVFKRPQFIDSYNWGQVERAATDAEGRFTIPAKRITMPWSRFLQQSLFVRHPLYAPPGMVRLLGEDRKPLIGTVRGGELVIEMKITSLEDKFSKPEDNADLSIFFESVTPTFFLLMRDEFGVKYDLPQILEKWQYLAGRYPEGTARDGVHLVQREMNSLRFRIRDELANY